MQCYSWKDIFGNSMCASQKKRFYGQRNGLAARHRARTKTRVSAIMMVSCIKPASRISDLPYVHYKHLVESSNMCCVFVQIHCYDCVVFRELHPNGKYIPRATICTHKRTEPLRTTQSGSGISGFSEFRTFTRLMDFVWPSSE